MTLADPVTKIPTLCPRCSSEMPDGAGFCERCTAEDRFHRPPRPARALPADEVWRALFVGGKFGPEVKRIPGLVDDAERLAARGPVAREHARRAGKGWRAVTLDDDAPTASPLPKDGGELEEEDRLPPPAPDPVGEEAMRARPDLEARIRRELRKALEGAAMVHEARNAIDRLVPSEVVETPTPIGRQRASVDCIVCAKGTVRARRGMDEPCYRAWIDAGRPDIGLWAPQRRAWLAEQSKSA